MKGRWVVACVLVGIPVAHAEEQTWPWLLSANASVFQDDVPPYDGTPKGTTWNYAAGVSIAYVHPRWRVGGRFDLGATRGLEQVGGGYRGAEPGYRRAGVQTGIAVVVAPLRLHRDSGTTSVFVEAGFWDRATDIRVFGNSGSYGGYFYAEGEATTSSRRLSLGIADTTVGGLTLALFGAVAHSETVWLDGPENCPRCTSTGLRAVIELRIGYAW